MVTKELDSAWIRWVQENLELKYSPLEMIDVLLRNGFAPTSIVNQINLFIPDASQLVVEALERAERERELYLRLAQIPLAKNNPNLNIERIRTGKLQLYSIEKFLSNEDCERIIELSARKLQPSWVITNDMDSLYRTSTTSYLSRLDDQYLARIDEKIAKTMGIRQSYSEGMQAQRYEVGQEYKPHVDYFAPGSVEYATFGSSGGQRTWTFMVYLNDGMKGGGTQFLKINKIFQPRRGTAVIWNNLYPDGKTNPDTIHAGLPVEEGFKVIITAWFRSKGVGTMFYCDAPQD